MSRALVALVVLTAFALAAFGWRSYLQLRRYGDTGLRLGPPAGTVPRLAHFGFVVSLVVAFVAPVAAMAADDASAPLGIRSWTEGTAGTVTFVVGLLLAAVGVVLTLVAQVQMGESWRVGVDESERTALVTTGLFSSVRNPIFTSMLVGVAGLALLVPSAIGIGAFVLAVVSLELQVRWVEEPYLLERHGDSYRRWASGTGRFLPGIGRLSPT